MRINLAELLKQNGVALTRGSKLFLLFLLSGCITSNNRFYNTITDCKLIVLDKRYVPGFQSPDKYLLKVYESGEYRWLSSSVSQYKVLAIGDTLKTTLIQKVQ